MKNLSLVAILSLMTAHSMYSLVVNFQSDHRDEEALPASSTPVTSPRSRQAARALTSSYR